MSKQISKHEQERNLVKLLYSRDIKEVDLLVKASQASVRTVQRVIRSIKLNQTIETKSGSGRPRKLNNIHSENKNKDMIRNLINSMPGRIEKCLKAKGGSFK